MHSFSLDCLIIHSDFYNITLSVLFCRCFTYLHYFCIRGCVPPTFNLELLWKRRLDKQKLKVEVEVKLKVTVALYSDSYTTTTTTTILHPPGLCLGLPG